MHQRPSRLKKFINTLEALIDLMRIEYEMLERIRLNGKGENRVEYYSDFSASKITSINNTVLYTKVIYSYMREYINWNLSEMTTQAEMTTQENIKKVNQLKQKIEILWR